MRKQMSFVLAIAVALSLAASVVHAAPIPAATLTGAGDANNLGGFYSVGWKFHVADAITVTALGQFDPVVAGSVPTTNDVAIYSYDATNKIIAQIVKATVAGTITGVNSGVCNARYLDIPKTLLEQGDYMVFSTQKGEAFSTPANNGTASFAPDISYLGSIAKDYANGGSLPADGSVSSWGINDGADGHPRYFGPTFTYEQGNTVVPEPSTVALLITGLLGLVCVWRKRK